MLHRRKSLVQWGRDCVAHKSRLLWSCVGLSRPGSLDANELTGDSEKKLCCLFQLCVKKKKIRSRRCQLCKYFYKLMCKAAGDVSLSLKTGFLKVICKVTIR